jgi:hypothetical protein
MDSVTQTEQADQPVSKGSGCFFAIDQRTWQQVCGLGLNPAVAYLVLACGTGRDNRTTEWSVHAIEKYTGISRGRAGAAIKALAKVLQTSRPHGLPQYELLSWDEIEGIKRRRASARNGKDEHWIWLPKALVTGAAGEIAPVELMRQSQDVMTLRMFIDMYHAQDLAEHGGIPRRFVWESYNRKKVAQWAEYDVWGFDQKNWTVNWNGFTLAHHAGREADTFFARLRTLVSLGLVEFIPTLFESDAADAETIHPCHDCSDNEVERDLARATRLAAEAMMSGHEGIMKRAEEFSLLAPVRRHIANVQVIGIARLRYRPRTRRTAAWWQSLNEKGERYITRYSQLQAKITGRQAAA